MDQPPNSAPSPAPSPAPNPAPSLRAQLLREAPPLDAEDAAELAAVPVNDIRPYWETEPFAKPVARWGDVLPSVPRLLKCALRGRLGDALRQAKALATTIRNPDSGTIHQRAAARVQAAGRPLVSVIIPCYNYGDFLDAAVDSVLRQTFQDFEIVIVDDGSPDPGTQAKIAEYVARSQREPHPRHGIKVLQQQNTGLSGARNAGIGSARGTYILCLDADDTLEATCLEKQVAVLELYAEPGAATPASRKVNAETTRSNGGTFNLGIMAHVNLNVLATMYRREDWQAVGGHSHYMRLGFEDWEFWCKLALRGVQAHHIREELLLYNVRPGTMLSRSAMKHRLLRASITKANPRLLDNAHCAGITTAYRNTLRENPFGTMLARHQAPAGRRSLLFFLRQLNTGGGAQWIMQQVARHALTMGWHVIFVGMDTDAELMGVHNKAYTGITPEVYNLGTFLPVAGWQAFVDFLIGSRNVTAIFGNTVSVLYNWAPGLKAKFPGLRIIDGIFVPEEGGIAYARAHLGAIDSYVVEFEAGRRELRMGGVPDRQIAVVPNGVRLNVFHPGKRDPNFRRGFEELCRGGPPLLVGFCGRLAETKNVDLLVQMIVRLSDVPNVQFLIAGSGPQQAMITDLAPHVKTLHYLGNVNNTAALMANLDLLLIPSFTEGRPNAMLEALASGTPVLGSTAGAMPEVIRDGETGWVLHPSDIDGFEARLRDLAANPAPLTPMRAKCRAYAEQCLDVQPMLDGYLQLLAGD